MRLITTKPRLSPPQSSLCVAGRLGFSIIATHFYWDNKREPLRRREKPRYRGGRKGVQIPQNRTESHTPNRFQIARKFTDHILGIAGGGVTIPIPVISSGPSLNTANRWVL